ncbi:hypothetical protein FJZ26_05660, partial [Candidatus Parvarchaeota archaeon]|nr:hypothetical protein [Candidatus Parvarchaeota archaeon]
MDLNGAWKSTCKVLLGGEIGDLAGYERYLLKYVEPVVEKKSCLSGNSTYLSSDQFSAGAHFISQNEIPKYQKRLADLRLGINEMKDIESIFSSISEAACYCGDVVL